MSGLTGVFYARLLHSTSKFAMTVLSKCVIHAGFVMIRQGGMNPSGNACLSKELTLWNDLWIYIFESVIRLCKVKQLAISPGLTCRCRFVEQLAAVLGFTFLPFTLLYIAGSCDNKRVRSPREYGRSSTISHYFTWSGKAPGHTCRCGDSFFLWSLARFNCARNSGVDDLCRLQGCEMNAEGLWALSRIVHAMWMHHVKVFCWLAYSTWHYRHVPWTLS